MENNDTCNKSLPIGTVVTFADGDKVKVVEKYDGCYKCYFLGNGGCNVTNHIRKIIGDCSETKRKDNTDVVFIPFTGELEEAVTDEGGHGTNITGTLDNTKEGTLQSNVPTTTQVVIPDGYEIDVDNCDLVKGIIKFKKKYITLDDVYNHIMYNHQEMYSDAIEYIRDIQNKSTHHDYMLAVANLLDIAQYYNGDWQPDFINSLAYNYYIKYLGGVYRKYTVEYTTNTQVSLVYFKTRQDAQAVIDNPNFREILEKVYKHE